MVLLFDVVEGIPGCLGVRVGKSSMSDDGGGGGVATFFLFVSAKTDVVEVCITGVSWS